MSYTGYNWAYHTMTNYVHDRSYHVFLETVLIHLAREKDMDFQRKGYGFCILELRTLDRIRALDIFVYSC